MIKRSEVNLGKTQAQVLLAKAHVTLSAAELDAIEVADFGLGNWPYEGSQIATFFNSTRVGFKVICLLPNQTLPEHWHTAVGEDPGKEETLRVVYGTLRLFLPGEEGVREGFLPKLETYTCHTERVMHVPEQLTMKPGTKHFLQGGEEGCVVYSISSTARCALDPFTDPAVKRMSKILEDEVE